MVTSYFCIGFHGNSVVLAGIEIYIETNHGHLGTLVHLYKEIYINMYIDMHIVYIDGDIHMFRTYFTNNLIFDRSCFVDFPETLLVVAGLGIQTTATFYMGKQHTRFIPWGSVVDIVIAETISMVNGVVLCYGNEESGHFHVHNQESRQFSNDYLASTIQYVLMLFYLKQSEIFLFFSEMFFLLILCMLISCLLLQKMFTIIL